MMRCELTAFGRRCFIAAYRRPSWRFRVNGRRSRGGFIDRLCLFPHHADKADAFARERADQPLLVAIVADGGPYRIDAGGKRRFRNNAPAPDCLKNIVLADDAVAIGDQVFQ